MEHTVVIIALVVGLLCFIVVALRLAEDHPRLNFLGLGLASWIFATLIEAWK